MDNNSKFIDIMDKVNQAAKIKEYKNGIAWAREAFEQKKIDQLAYNAYEKCHNMRNLIAHGAACEIMVSDTTLESANAFYQAVAEKPAEQHQPAEQPQQIPKPQYHPTKTPIRVGDYVIMMRYEKRYWSNFSTTPDETVQEQRQFTPGFVFRVEDKDLNLYSLTAPNGDTAERRWMMEHSDRAYIFRTEQELDIPGKSLYVIERPACTKADGKHYLTFQYVQYDAQEEDRQVQELTCEGYLADPYTFTCISPKVFDRDDDTATIKDGEEITVLPKNNTALHSHIRMDDFVIMMREGEYYWGTFSERPDPDAKEQRIIRLGMVGQITDPKLKKFYMLTYGNDAEFKYWLDYSEAIYIFRTDRIMDYGLTPYIIDEPVEFEKDGKPYLKIRYVQHDERCPMWTKELDLICEGYKAGENTFEWLNKVYDTEGKHPLN